MSCRRHPATAHRADPYPDRWRSLSRACGALRSEHLCHDQDVLLTFACHEPGTSPALSGLVVRRLGCAALFSQTIGACALPSQVLLTSCGHGAWTSDHRPVVSAAKHDRALRSPTVQPSIMLVAPSIRWCRIAGSNGVVSGRYAYRVTRDRAAAGGACTQSKTTGGALPRPRPAPTPHRSCELDRTGITMRSARARVARPSRVNMFVTPVHTYTERMSAPPCGMDQKITVRMTRCGHDSCRCMSAG
jgi:hypothetical protein